MNRYNVRVFFDVSYSNPNGDPDNNNHPRVNFYNDTGFTTDACLKRLIRDAMYKIGENEKTLENGNNIFYSQDAVLESYHIKCLEDLKIKSDGRKNKKNKSEIREWYLKNFIDIRLFGAVLVQSMLQMRGPVTVTFSKSSHPVDPTEIAITRCCIEKKEAEIKKLTNATMGKKWVIPYGLYYFDVFIDGNGCDKMQVSKEDISLLFRSIQNMFLLNKSASKSDMNFIKMFVFEHDSPLGLGQNRKDFDRIKINKKFDEQADFPSSIDDFEIILDKIDMPFGITVKEIE